MHRKVEKWETSSKSHIRYLIKYLFSYTDKTNIKQRMLTISLIENGNIFNSSCKTIVNPINCVGVMGKGIALEMKNRFPHMFERYQTLCNKHLITVGKLWLYQNEDGSSILNFPTKEHWKENSKYEFIEMGMKKFLETYQEKQIKSIAFPLLGCGNGKLNKTEVLNIMMKYIIQCKNLIVEIYT